MKKLYLFLCLSLFACSSGKVATSLPVSTKFSPQFQLFWNAFCEETKGMKSLKNYVPSEQLVKDYVLQQENGKYILTGFLSADKKFDASSVEKMGGSLSAYGDTYSFRIPVNRIREFVSLPGLVRVESARKIQMK